MLSVNRLQILFFFLLLAPIARGQYPLALKVNQPLMNSYIQSSFLGSMHVVHQAVLSGNLKAYKDEQLQLPFTTRETDTLGGLFEQTEIMGPSDPEFKKDTMVLNAFLPEQFTGFLLKGSDTIPVLQFSFKRYKDFPIEESLYFLSFKDFRKYLQNDQDVFWSLLLEQLQQNDISRFRCSQTDAVAGALFSIFKKYTYTAVKQKQLEAFKNNTLETAIDSAGIETIYAIRFIPIDLPNPGNDSSRAVLPEDIQFFDLSLNVTTSENNISITPVSIAPAHYMVVTGIDKFSRSLYYLNFNNWMQGNQPYKSFFNNLVTYTLLQRADVYDTYTPDISK